MQTNLTFVDEVNERANKLSSIDRLLGRGLIMPNAPSNSGARKLMHVVQTEQKIELTNGEVPLVSTGYESRYGEYSSAWIKAKSNYKVIAKIEKFKDYPGHHYILILYDLDNNEYTMIERCDCKHISEEYGFTYNTKRIDKYQKDDIINKDTVLIKSNSFDEYGNRKDGVNLLTTYLSNDHTKEDGIVLSETAKNKLEAPLIHRIEVVINDNDIPLNLYGNENLYKIFPDINEKINGKILMSIRRELKEQMLYLQSKQMLSRLVPSDDKFIVDGYVMDIDIYCNNQDLISTSPYLYQLNYYNKNYRRYLKEIHDTLMPIFEAGGKCSHDLEKLYYNANKILNGGQYIKDNLFSNIILSFLIYTPNELKVGDKISNRYGGKGVVSEIRPDEMMPKLDNGETVELLFNPASVINRENVGQLLELSTTFSGARIVEYLNSKVLDPVEMINIYCDFISHFSPKEAEYIKDYLAGSTVDECLDYLSSVFTDNGIMISAEPISESLGLDNLKDLYDKYEGIIEPYTVTVPQRRSDGKIRYIKSRRKLVCGRQYIYRLKQHAEEKFSAVSLSSTNLKNENCRNNLDKFYKTTHTKTCVKFGEMETGDLMHLDPEIVVTNLMLYSLSPHGRRQFKNLLTGDPFNVDIKLNKDCSNRTVEIINTYLLTMGLELVFEKHKKKYISPFKKNDLIKVFENASEPIKVFINYNKDKIENPFVPFVTGIGTNNKCKNPFKIMKGEDL